MRSARPLRQTSRICFNRCCILTNALCRRTPCPWKPCRKLDKTYRGPSARRLSLWTDTDDWNVVSPAAQYDPLHRSPCGIDCVHRGRQTRLEARRHFTDEQFLSTPQLTGGFGVDGRAASNGNDTTAARPPSARLCRTMSPPCARATALALASPRPVPPVSRFRDASAR